VITREALRNPVDPLRPYLFFAEDERSGDGEIVSVNTLFLTNRECPWRCVMCDLWKNTLTQTVPPGAIPAQIEYALARLSASRHIKLYNSGSFFDPRAIPPADYPAIAAQLRPFERVIVESHPALIGENCMHFRDLIPGRLEVAMGLETVHPEVLPRLNKGMTLDQFSDAAERLRESAIDLRVFVLVKPPFLPEADAVRWAQRSVDFAFECGATVTTLIPTRGGKNPPSIATLEASVEYGVGLASRTDQRVFADLWDLERFSTCPLCFPARSARLRQMNLHQEIPHRIDCPACHL
jgi:radical SAM enzyme (TIGR01210 family)